MSDSLMQRPQTRLLLIQKNQICQQLGGGQAALVTGQRGKEERGSAIIRADRVPLFI